MKRSTDRILTTHTGSLPRPPDLNDGEAGKIGYSTYVTERLEGFGGEADPPGPPPDMLEFPEYLARERGDGAGPAMPACDGPIAYRDTAAVRADIAALREAVDGVDGVEEAFLRAA